MISAIVMFLFLQVSLYHLNRYFILWLYYDFDMHQIQE